LEGLRGSKRPRGRDLDQAGFAGVIRLLIRWLSRISPRRIGSDIGRIAHDITIEPMKRSIARDIATWIIKPVKAGGRLFAIWKWNGKHDNGPGRQTGPDIR
jgi:hypothetical protein